MHLPPFLVFSSEITRLNRLYWMSRYCNSRTTAILQALASVGHKTHNPRVDTVWPSTTDGEARSLTITMSAFSDKMDDLLEDLRATSILHACSAFETALVGYFCICLLYNPGAVSRFNNLAPIPTIIRTPSDYTTLLTESPSVASGCLGGKYSRRLKELESRFALSLVPHTLSADLDAHYEQRHRVAHAQSLDNMRLPNWSHNDVLKGRLKISETDWKKMLADFYQVIKDLDECIRLEVVTDGFLSIAIDRILSARGELRARKIRDFLQYEWGISARCADISTAAAAAGYRVTPHPDPARRLVYR